MKFLRVTYTLVKVILQWVYPSKVTIITKHMRRIPFSRCPYLPWSQSFCTEDAAAHISFLCNDQWNNKEWQTGFMQRCWKVLRWNCCTVPTRYHSNPGNDSFFSSSKFKKKEGARYIKYAMMYLCKTYQMMTLQLHIIFMNNNLNHNKIIKID